LTGATGVSGSFSGSFIGDGSQLTFLGTGIVSGSEQITISQTTGFTAFSSSIATSIAGITDTDNQTLSFNQVSKRLTISDGNTVDLSSLGGGGGGGSSIWSTGSSYYYVSSDLQVTGSFHATSLTGSIAYSNLTNVPSGLVSSSTQVLSYLPNGTVSGSEQITFSGLSGKPSGLVSSSAQITDGSGIVSGSVLRTLDGTGVFSGSLVAGTNVTINQVGDNFEISSSGESTPAGTISSSAQVISSLPSGTVSGSTQITDGSGIFSGSLVAGTNITINQSGNDFIISSSASGDSIPAGTISSSAQVIDSLPSGVVSGSSQLTSSYDSRYLQTTTYTTDSASFDTRISNIGDHANIAPLNLFTQSADLRLDSIESFTSSIDTTIKTKLNTEDVLSGSIESLLPSGVVSGSTQITDGSGIVSGSVLRTLNGTGVVSGSVLRTLDSTGVFSGSLVAGTNITINQVGDNFEISSSASGGSVSVTVSDSAPGSPSQGDLWWKSDDGNLYIYYDSYWVISTDITTGLPAGVVSGSAQITSVITDTYISASAASSGFGSGGSSDFTTLTNVPSGLVSGSSQLTSSYDTRYLNVNGDDVVSGSVLRTLDGTGVVSGSVLRTLDGTGVVSGSVLRTLDGTGVISGSVLRTLDGTNVVSSSTQTISHLGGTNIFSGSVIGDGNITITSGSGNITVSGSAAQVTYNGNRIVSNEDLGDLFTNNFNAGTSGSITEFLNAVFFPNTAPSITTGNQTIEEFRANGASIVTLTGTDAEGQSLTFGTASSYTDDLVRVASGGAMTLNALATSASFNTDSVGAGHGHLVTVTATDTFSETTEKDIYIIVTPNEAPVFRETSASGNIITSVTANLNENSTNNTLVKRVFFTDAESDTITITTSSIDNEHFDVTIYSNYLDIRQNTGSLDYEQQTSYSFSITASDEHYPSPDSDSVTTLPITINVTDNLAPTVNNQVVGSINENSSNGAVVGTVSVSDSEGDSVSAPSFVLHKLLLDGSTVPSSSYGGTSQATDPHENPFEINSGNRQITRKSGVYLNSDLINQYQYRVKVKDNFNGLISSASVVSININDDVAATLFDNWSAGPYIKESELSGTTIKTTDYGSTQADYNSNQSGTWSSSNPAISINSNGNLSLNVNLSGSLTSSGDTIDSTITFTNTFGTTTTDALSVQVVANEAPTISFTNQSSNFNTNLATSGTTMVSMSVSDTEGDTPFSASLTGADAASLRLKYVNSNSSSIGIQAATDLSAATYNYNVRITDDFGKSRDYNSRSFTVVSAGSGTLTGDTTSYIIESAESGSLIRESSNGRTGAQADLNVSYSPNYGSQAVQSFTSSLSEIVVSNTGLLSLNVDISGSSTSSGDTISPTITWRDQYDNVGSSVITINVAENQAPTATFTDQSANFETDLATTGTTMVSMSISDTESDTPFSASLTGTNANDLQLKYVNSTSSSVGIQAASNLGAGTYNYNVKVTDSFGKSRTYSGRSFTVTLSSDFGKTYIYRSDYGSDAGLSSNYLAVMGASTVSGDTPPEVTAYTANNTSPFRLISSSLGDATLSLAGGGTATRVAILSGSDLDTIISESNPFTMGNSAEQYIVIVPSGSDMVGIPTSMTDGFGGSTTGEFVMAVKADGGSWGTEGSTIHLLDTSGSFNGYDKHFVIGRTGHNSAASVELRIIESSGSLPS
jgi:hypothetical protein